MYMKRLLSFFLSLCLAAALFMGGAMAASGPALTYDLSANGENSVTAEAGSTVTVTFCVLNSQAHSVLSMQNEIVFDTDFFTLVSADAVKSGTAANELPRTTDAANHLSRIKATGMNADYAAEETVCTVQLQIKADATGSSVVKCEQFKARDAENKPITITAQDLTVTVGTVTETDHTVTVNSVTNGSIAADKTSAKEGETVTLTITPDEGYELDTLTVKDGAGNPVAVADGKFTMPAANVTVSATFKQKEYSITVRSASNGSVSASASKALKGTVIALNVTPADGYELASLSVLADGQPITVTGNRFFMPAADVTVSATFSKAQVDTSGMNLTSSYWDGISVDVSWYLENSNRSSYSINTAAEFAGVAALVNGLVNEDCRVYTGSAVYSASEWNNGIYVNADIGTTGSNNQATANYWYGVTRFHGVTIYLQSDLNMSAGNWMPIGGAYLMTDEDTSTKVGGSFCGVLNGNGHNITIQCDRHCSGNYGDGANVGLIGRLGASDNDPASWQPASAGVRNLAVYGSVKGNRSVGGIVGKIGATAGTAVIQNCANYADVTGTDAKGTGGIVGAGWNDGEVRNCYNAGDVINTGNPAVGGIVGSCEIPVINCYNVGEVIGIGNTASIASNNGGSSYENVYWLTGTADVGVYGSSSSEVTEKTSAEMQTEEFVNALGSAFAKDTRGINSGYPVLSWQNPSAPTGTGEKKEEPESTVTTTVEGGKATVTVDGDKLAEELEDSGEREQVVISAEVPKNETVAEVTAELPVSAVEAVVDSGASLKVETPVADVILSNETLKEIAESNKTVAVTAKVNKTTGAVTIEVAAGGKAMEEVSGGVTVSIPAQANDGNILVIVHSDGTETVVKKHYVDENDNHKAILPGSVTVKVVEKNKKFVDVQEEDWFADGVAFVGNRGLFEGVGNDVFDHAGTMTRAMLVTVLHRLEDEMEHAYEGAFHDVEEDEWYTDAVHWAADHGIVEGYGNGYYGTHDEITREQMITMVYRYLTWLGMDTSARGDLSTFTDHEEISDWAMEAMEWSVGVGLIEGVGNNLVDPKGNATRAQVAVFLQRMITHMVQ